MTNRFGIRLALALAVGLFAVPRPATAQTVGSITGTVYDQTGLPLAGITIVASSDTQIGGSKTVRTNSEGAFRITGLSPGRFTVRASAPKLKTHEQKNVKVTINADTDINIVMEVETEVEEIKIVEKAPVVNTTSTVIKETFDEEFINNIPLASRSYQGVATLAAGVSDAGGGNPNVRGGSYFNNSYTVDGVDTTDPVTHTFGTNFNFDAMADVEVQTASKGAEYSDTVGGVINVVTKSGSNKFEVDTTMTYTDQNLRFNEDQLDIGSFRQASLNLNVGGPIKRDRLWFFVSGEFIHGISDVSRDPTGTLPDHPPFSQNFFNGVAKVTWQVTPRHKLTLSSIYSPAEINNLFRTNFVEPEAEARQYQQSNQGNLQWEALLQDNLFLRLNVSGQRTYLDVGPQSCEWDADCANRAGGVDVATGVLRGNYTRLSKDARRSFRLNADIEWFKDTKRFGNHDIKFGTKIRVDENPSSVTVPGDEILYTLGGQPYARSQYCANDPQLSSNECRPGWLHSNVQGWKALTFLQNAWKPIRYLTVTPGVAMHNASSKNEGDTTVMDVTTYTGHLGAVWDATHDGRTAVRASFNQYVDTGFLALARFTSRSLFQRTCYYDEDAKEYIQQCNTSGGVGDVTVGQPEGPNSDVTRELRSPRVWEYTLGVERELIQGLSLGADFIYRKFVHQFEDIETNLIWNESGTGLRADGGYKDGKSHYIFDLETPDEANRRYEAVTAVLRKKEGKLRVLAQYTWSRNEGQVDDNYASAYLDNPKNSVYWTGYLPTDQRHVATLAGSYSFTQWFSVGLNYVFASGTPYNRWFYNSYYQSFSDLRAKQGYDPGRNINNPADDRELRLPDVSVLAVQARASLKKFTGQQIDVFADIFNVLGLRTNLSVFESDGPLWGQPTGQRLGATRARLGLRYRY